MFFLDLLALASVPFRTPVDDVADCLGVLKDSGISYLMP
jgi:hypothetical protein